MAYLHVYEACKNIKIYLWYNEKNTTWAEKFQYLIENRRNRGGIGKIDIPGTHIHDLWHFLLGKAFRWKGAGLNCMWQLLILKTVYTYMRMFYRSLFVLLSFFFMSIVLSVLLRFTDSDYPVVIFKLHNINWLLSRK